MRPAILTVMTQVLSDASRGLLRDFGEIQNLSKISGFLDNARQRIERFLMKDLERRDDSVPIMVRNPEFTLDYQGACWVLEVFDGQENFAHALKNFSTRLILWEKGRVLAYALYDPLSHELFSAYEGQGAFNNQSRLRVSSRKNTQGSFIALDGIKFAPKIAEQAHIRQTGCPSLDVAHVAAGRFEGCCLYAPQKPWVHLANALLIKESNGFCCHERGVFVAGNEVSFGWLKKVVAEVSV